MYCRHDEWYIFRKFGSGVSEAIGTAICRGYGVLTLWPIADSFSKLVDEISLIVPVLFPYIEEVEKLLDVLGGVRESGGALD